MVNYVEHSMAKPGARARLGDICHRTGLLRLMQMARSWLRSDVRILAYHRVLRLPDQDAFDFDIELVSASPEGFREQMLLLKRHFQPVSLVEAIATLDAGRYLPANAVAVTFDDGYDDNYRIAFPILRELGIPATFFVSTGHIDSGEPYHYDWLVHMILVTRAPTLSLPELGIDTAVPPSRSARRALASQVLRALKNIDVASQSILIDRLEREWQMPRGPNHPDCRPMRWDQLREMRAAGFEIGSHGVHHHMLAKLPQEELESELNDSRASIEMQMHAPARLISYPVGGDRAFDQRVISATRNAGYVAACSYICGTNPRNLPDRYALYRLPVERVMGAGWFDAMLTLPELMGYPTASRAGNASREAACLS